MNNPISFIAAKNEQHFVSLQNTKTENNNSFILIYPNIKEFKIENNIIKYQNYEINLGNLELYSLDSSIFSLEISEILFILNKLSKYINDKEGFNKEINYMLFLQSLTELNEEHKNYIIYYLNEFYHLKKITEKFFSNTLINLYKEFIIPISEAYLHENEVDTKYNKPACAFIRLYETNLIEDSFNNSSNNNGHKLVRKNGNQIQLPSNDEPFGLNAAAGFANTMLVISVTTTIGITIAILTIFLT